MTDTDDPRRPGESTLELPTPEDVRRDLTRMAVAGAHRSVPLQLANVALVVAMALEAGLRVPAVFAALIGGAVGVWRWSIGRRFGHHRMVDAATVGRARQELELNAGLAGVLWTLCTLTIYPYLTGSSSTAYTISIAGSMGIAAMFASLTGRAFAFLLVPQVGSLVIASIVFDEVQSVTMAVLSLLYGLTLYRAAIEVRRSAENLVTTLLERDALRDDHARLAETALQEARRAANAAQAAAIAARDLFVAKVSHEFRTPLQTIVSVAELMQDKVAAGGLKSLEGPMKRLHIAADQLMHQAQDLANYVRAQSGRVEVHPEKIQLLDWLMGATAELNDAARAKGLQFIVKAPDLPVVVDAMRLQQIVINLSSNAVKFTVTGGVRVSAEVSDLGGGRATLRLVVEDTGVGIAEDMQTRVFDPWVRVDERQPGLGLGLSIVKSLVDAMAGSVAVASRIGEGTTVEVGLPVGLGQRSDHVDHPAPHRLDMRVLVVDDNATARQAVCDVLEAGGVRCEQAGTGPEALSMLEKQAFDALLLDLQMPNMDGYEVAGRVRELAAINTSHLRIVAMSAYDLDPQRASRFDAFVAKPATYHDLAQALVETAS